MRKSIYPRLAWANIRKNRQYYKPYILAGMMMTAMFYMIAYLAGSQNLTRSVTGSSAVVQSLSFGMVTIAIFSVVFILYTNSFLFKRRLTEFGLYNVLGMEKRHIVRMLAFENLYVSLLIIAGGIAAGILFSRLCLLILLQVLQVNKQVTWEMPLFAVRITVILFLAAYLLAFIGNVIRIGRTDTIRLLYSSNEGEKEPKANPAVAVAGAVCLIAGYIMANTIQSPLAALAVFFVAVDLVIAGTYMVFISTSVWVLALLKRNRNFYYQPRHFINISSMMYRMKQNAVGMANICILSTMVLVTVSTCVSIYSGAGLMIESMCPADISVSAWSDNTAETQQVLSEAIRSRAEEMGIEITSMQTYTNLAAAVTRRADGSYAFEGANRGMVSVMADVMILQDYNMLYGTHYELQGNEIMHIVSNGISWHSSQLTLGDTTYTIKEKLSKEPAIFDKAAAYAPETHYLVVADEAVMAHLYEEQAAAYGEDASHYNCDLLCNMNGTAEEKAACAKAVFSADQRISGFAEKESTTRDVRGLDSGFLFLGVFLAITFAVATVLIIYYKQISEGYDDRKRFEIMQNVGMSREEIRKNTDRQVLTVFLLPLAVSCLHLLGSSKMMMKILVLFGILDARVFAVCAVCTVAAFALVYLFVYRNTSRVYEKIVSARQ